MKFIEIKLQTYAVADLAGITGLSEHFIRALCSEASLAYNGDRDEVTISEAFFRALDKKMITKES